MRAGREVTAKLRNTAKLLDPLTQRKRAYLLATASARYLSIPLSTRHVDLPWSKFKLNTSN